MVVLIVGGTGGIGSALISIFQKQGYHVHATYHIQPATTDAGISWYPCDATDDHSVERLAASVGHIDLLINCIGILYTDLQLPEKSIQQFNVDFFQKNIQTNTLPTLLLAKHFQSRLKAPHPTYFICLSAKVGSIEDNHLGGWISYRASKAALNMCIKTIAIEWKTKLPKCCVIAFHPGTIDTPLSVPFQKRISKQQLNSPDWLAEKLNQLIDELGPGETGRFYNYASEILPW
ncbi:SDR family NAD(P)-dependent oxidoreductase [Vibrio astriarenae]|uniref:SDR family NAD(P)-dependent oxidoreductase n=1 Tax=Vibrio astriarenae TaxID=1481923 RepID=UPI003736C9CF